MFLFTIVIVLARLASVACVQETHSVTLFSRCNTTSGGGAIALLNGIGPSGSDTVEGPLIHGIAWVDRFVGADCETSGINCATVEFTLQNNATNGAFFNLATQPESGNHQFTYPMSFQFDGACDQGAVCSSPTDCPFESTTPGIVNSLQCSGKNVGITVIFC